MKIKTLIFALLLSNIVFGQNNTSKNSNKLLSETTTEVNSLYTPNYPEGIYTSKKDFIAKKPSSLKTVVMKNFNKKVMDSIIHDCYFYYSDNNKKVRNVFAISYKGHLYFQIKAILKNRNKTDRAQNTNYHNMFVRTIIGGENYLYTEAELVNQWAMGTAVNFGAIGGAIANDLIKGKGIVWDFKNKEFNIFKSCKDYNKFIEDKLPEAVQECKKHQPDMLGVRKAIEKIK
ncbi:hypothetical protein MK851_09045 [Tenacibaculum sp. 1B UA]|uniref:hypothetical protein n=1 Tax=unclassified Tenacibaculum TaxID=2635139 RepID=UPI0026E44711|nr:MULTISPECIES: hypothetical protein [unclassified Tenacibaculum]MDO6674581.1 hypothetical protein [Tenacibaculum sp. 1_MG-2023]MDX8553766.1 hypothetical protein [Tenacibaculum sp. 1B UA]